MKAMFIKRKYLIVALGVLFSTALSQNIDPELRIKIEKLQENYTQGFLNTQKEKELRNAVKKDMNLFKGRKKDLNMRAFLQLWEIKSYFLNGEIEEAKNTYREMINSTKVDSIPWRKILYHEPFIYEMNRCNKGNCLCKVLDHEINNLDFLDPYHFAQHFKDLSIEFGDASSGVIPIKKRSVVKGEIHKKGRNEIEILMDPPNAQFREVKYSADFDYEDMLNYYFINAKKNRLNNLEDSYEQDGKFYPLKFVDSYLIDEDKWKMKIRYLPTTKEFSEDVNRTYYKFYLRDGENILRRYSRALIQEEVFEDEEDENNNNLDEASLLIDWDEKWDMQELKDEGKLIFLLPAIYINPDEESAFRLNNIPLSQSEKLKDRGIIISDNYEPELLKKYGENVAVENNGKTLIVYHVEVEFNPEQNKPVELEFTRDYSLFNEQEKEVKRAMKWLYITFSVCLGLLLIL